VPGLLRFLLGRFFYSDAVNTLIVVMSVVAVRAVGLTQGQWLITSVVLTVVAIVASFGWGYLVDRFGPKKTLIAVLASWVVGLLLGVASLALSGTTPDRDSSRGRDPRQRPGRRPGRRRDPVPHRPGSGIFGLYGLGKGSGHRQLFPGVILFVFFDRPATRHHHEPSARCSSGCVAGLARERPWSGGDDLPGRGPHRADLRPSALPANDRTAPAARRLVRVASGWRWRHAQRCRPCLERRMRRCAEHVAARPAEATDRRIVRARSHGELDRRPTAVRWR
jgi:hypothetical protein